jgi:tRNA threonylcarbamoyladenosine biosynthesis protein TsaB
MLLLAVDTCDARGSIALLREGRFVQQAIHDTAEDYSSWLLPAVNQLLHSAGVRVADLQVCAVATGPGSFTGVRVGLTTAKAWSEVYGLSIAAVSRLDALSTYSSGKASVVAAFTDAHRKQVFGAVYRCENGELKRVGDEVVTSPDAFIEQAVAAAAQARIEWISPDPKGFAEAQTWPSRLAQEETIHVIAPVFAPAIGRIGYRLAQEGRFTDSLSLDANYVRRSDAELFWKKGAHGG